MAGVTATDWSWTPALFDVDLDGWLDLLVTAGQERASRDLDGAEHMKAFRRAGLRTDAQSGSGRDFRAFPPDCRLSETAASRVWRNPRV